MDLCKLELLLEQQANGVREDQLLPVLEYCHFHRLFRLAHLLLQLLAVRNNGVAGVPTVLCEYWVLTLHKLERTQEAADLILNLLQDRQQRLDCWTMDRLCRNYCTL